MMTKEQIRKQAKEKRLQLSPGEKSSLSESIVQTALTHFQVSGKTISLFLPIEKQHEINTYLLLDKAKEFGATVAIPKSNFQTHEMKHYVFENIGQLNVNSFGIPEPTKGKLIAADHFDIVFVPLLAIDANGNRVGYGKGFYDRFLRKCSAHCLFVGLHYFDIEPDLIEDVLPNDVKLHAVVLPDRIVRFNQ
jgi:5-formyltetrahydrofolate cyclo-ligase